MDLVSVEIDTMLSYVELFNFVDGMVFDGVIAMRRARAEATTESDIYFASDVTYRILRLAGF